MIGAETTVTRVARERGMSVIFMILFLSVFGCGGILFVSLHHHYSDLVWCLCSVNLFMFAGERRGLAVRVSPADPSQGCC